VNHIRESFIAELGEEFAVARKIAAIEYGDIEFGVIPLKFFAFAEKPMYRANPKAQIP
jgi:hypothetical protein